jgi:hypothetical protein
VVGVGSRRLWRREAIDRAWLITGQEFTGRMDG